MPDSYADIQRVATSKVSAIVKYSFRIMNNAKVLPSCSEEVSKTSAYIKLFSGFLAMDELLVRHPLQVYVESASLLATELGNPKDCKHLITLKELDYIHHWNEQSLKLHGDLTNQYIANDLPILFKIVADDIKSDGYDIETSILPDSIFAYLKDNPPTESPDDSDSSDDEYILQIDQTFDEINTLIPNVSLWKAFRKIAKENFNLYYDEVFANKQSRPSPQKYVIEYTIISICGSLKKEPMVDSSGKLSDIGKYMQDAAFRLGNYGVKTGSLHKILGKLFVRICQRSQRNPVLLNQLSKRSIIEKVLIAFLSFLYCPFSLRLVFSRPFQLKLWRQFQNHLQARPLRLCPFYHRTTESNRFQNPKPAFSMVHMQQAKLPPLR